MEFNAAQWQQVVLLVPDLPPTRTAFQLLLEDPQGVPGQRDMLSWQWVLGLGQSSVSNRNPQRKPKKRVCLVVCLPHIHPDSRGQWCYLWLVASICALLQLIWSEHNIGRLGLVGLKCSLKTKSQEKGKRWETQRKAFIAPAWLHFTRWNSDAFL